MALFGLAIITLLPALGHLFATTDRISSSENRYLAGLPSDVSGVVDFTKKMDVYLNDNFGFRQEAVKFERKIKRQLGDNNDTIYAGTDNWLFWGEHLIWDSFIGHSGFSEKSLDQGVKLLKTLNSEAKKQGANFAAMIAPNKASIYPEYAPQRFGLKSSRNFYDYLMARFEIKGLNLVNVKPVLLDLKSTQQIYYKTDTHWTLRGAYEAYQLLFNSIKIQNSNIDILNLELSLIHI